MRRLLRPATGGDRDRMGISAQVEQARAEDRTDVGQHAAEEAAVRPRRSGRRARLAENVEDRLAEFTDLVATAIARSQARDELTRLVEEHAALRRVATLVARDVPSAEVFAAVSAEVAQLVGAEAAALTRYEPDGKVIVLGGWTDTGFYEHVGQRF